MFFWLGTGLLDSMNHYSNYLKIFHDLELLLLIFLLSFIFLFIFILLISSMMKLNYKESSLIEMSWSSLPIIILFLISWPSMQLLYLSDLPTDVFLTFKVTGSQWYWKYNFMNFKDLEIESFLVLEDSLKLGDFRLLEVDNKVVLPFSSMIRVLVSSSDVLHSWALPGMGLKVDANPGRINQIFLYSSYPGIFYGQCSELCGVNHSFMPIVVEFTSLELFSYYIFSS